jgi:glycosyltransferase involved in cell wall biosynthesis
MRISEIEKRRQKLQEQWTSRALETKQRQRLEQEIHATELEWNKANRRLSDTPKISVVMSVYNTERFVGQAVKSILDQTFGDFEIVLIDDGSSDRSVEIVRSFNDPRIRVVHQTNHGLVYSFNKGLELARSEIIARMDADDISLPRRFEQELAWLKADVKRGLVGTFFSYIDEESGKPLDIVMTSPTKHIDIVRMMHIVNPFGHGSIMMRKKAAESLGKYRSEYEPAEDYDLWRRIAQEWEVGQIPEVLYMWRFHPASISRRKSHVSNASAEKTVENTWEQSEPFKSSRQIVKDGRYYQNLNSSLADAIYSQYIDHQRRLVNSYFEHKKMKYGYSTGLGLMRLAPRSVTELFSIMVKSTVKYIRGN